MLWNEIYIITDTADGTTGQLKYMERKNMQTEIYQERIEKLTAPVACWLSMYLYLYPHLCLCASLSLSLCIYGICVTILFRFYLFTFRERGREGKREGGKHPRAGDTSSVASSTPPAGNLACNPGMVLEWGSNKRPFSSQASTQSTEPHQPGRHMCNNGNRRRMCEEKREK